MIEWVKKKACVSFGIDLPVLSPVPGLDISCVACGQPAGGWRDVGLRGRGLCEAQRKVGVLAATPPFPSVGLGAGL